MERHSNTDPVGESKPTRTGVAILDEVFSSVTVLNSYSEERFVLMWVLNTSYNNVIISMKSEQIKFTKCQRPAAKKTYWWQNITGVQVLLIKST